MAKSNISEGPGQTRSSIAAVQSSQDTEEDDTNTLLQLLHTKERLQQQLLDHQVALKAAQNDKPPSSNEPENLRNRITTLQKELLEVNRDNSLRDLMISRLQLGHTLTQCFFPDVVGGGDSAQATDSQQSKIFELVEKQIELTTEILKQHKIAESRRPSLADCRQKNLDMLKTNRELMANLKEIQDVKKKQFEQQSDNQKVKSARDQLEHLVSKVVLLRHIFQGLILGSGINWAQDTEMTELLIGLGLPLDSQLEKFNKGSSV